MIRAAFLSCLVACGYHAVYGQSSEHFHVVLVRSIVADAVLAGEVTSGVRDALARDGALLSGDGYPRVEIEVLRVDEASDAIADRGGQPAARAVETGAVVHGWLITRQGEPPTRDTGDVRVMVAHGVDEGASASVRDLMHQADAAHAAARAVGQKIGQYILGHPVNIRGD